MKSFKRGRGPSMMGGVACIALAVFGVLWVVIASELTSSFSGDSAYYGGYGLDGGMTGGSFGSATSSIGSIFPLFGVVFIVIAIAGAIYNFRNATGKNRYSEFDIVDGAEEPDPLNARFGENASRQSDAPAFCPYCGNGLEGDHIYCDRCGKQIRK